MAQTTTSPIYGPEKAHIGWREKLMAKLAQAKTQEAEITKHLSTLQLILVVLSIAVTMMISIAGAAVGVAWAIRDKIDEGNRAQTETVNKQNATISDVSETVRMQSQTLAVMANNTLVQQSVLALVIEDLPLSNRARRKIAREMNNLKPMPNVGNWSAGQPPRSAFPPKQE
jgi:hypothetical protein